MNARRTILCAAERSLEAQIAAQSRALFADCQRSGSDVAEIRFIRLRLTSPDARVMDKACLARRTYWAILDQHACLSALLPHGLDQARNAGLLSGETRARE